LARERIFTLDPGGTTGWACVEFEGQDVRRARVDNILKDRKTRWASGEIASVGPRPNEPSGGDRYADGGEVFAARQAVEKIEKFRPSVLVIEDFILDMGRASGKRNLLSPVRLTSMIEYGLRISPVEEVRWLAAPGRLEFQSAANAKTVVTNSRLRQWGLWKVGEQHARDAIRHAVLYLRRLSAGRVDLSRDS